jgi:hypothetical protein
MPNDVKQLNEAYSLIVEKACCEECANEEFELVTSFTNDFGSKYDDCGGNIINSCSNGVTGLFNLKVISDILIRYFDISDKNGG